MGGGGTKQNGGVPTHVRSLADSAGDAKRRLTSSKEHLVASLAELMDYLYQSSNALDMQRWIRQSGGEGCRGGSCSAVYESNCFFCLFWGRANGDEEGPSRSPPSTLPHKINRLLTK